MTRRLSLLLLTLSLGCPLLRPATIVVDFDHPTATINPAMWGVFFEDINLGADGGLYAELIKNRAFEFPSPLMGWSIPGGAASITRVSAGQEPTDTGRARHYVTLVANETGAALENEGFRGIGIREGDTYDFSVLVRGRDGKLQVELLRQGGAVLASEVFSVSSTGWSEQRLSLKAKATEGHARLRLTYLGAGAVDLTQISLFPAKTWKGRPKGLRADMVQALADLGPGFVRFPGGCIVEGPKLELRYQWKKTIGPVEQRELLYNRWNQEFKNRAAPDYFQSFGLGFFEYFTLCEDLKAEPLPILNCGMACQYNSGELAPLSDLQVYIQDALDLIEFANGPVSSKWGAKRAALGHPAPFQMKYLGVGNEQWGPQYVERFAAFSEALHRAHPEVALVAAAGPAPDGESFKLAWEKLPALKADLLDEHCYAEPEWFFNNAHRFDRYDRNGPKVFMGEYAARGQETDAPEKRNTFLSALSEAAYLTGLERNADVVRMASYAPLFAHIDGWQWTPDLIWVDNLRVIPTANYYVQQLYARNRGDQVLPCAVTPGNAPEEKRFYASSTRDDATGEVIVKLVNATGLAGVQTIQIAGAHRITGGTLTRLEAAGLQDANAFDAPRSVVPTVEEISASEQGKLLVTLPGHSFAVLRLRLSHP